MTVVMEKAIIIFGFLGTEDFDHIRLQGNVTQGLNWNEISKRAEELLLV